MGTITRYLSRDLERVQLLAVLTARLLTGSLYSDNSPRSPASPQTDKREEAVTGGVGTEREAA